MYIKSPNWARLESTCAGLCLWNSRLHNYWIDAHITDHNYSISKVQLKSNFSFQRSYYINLPVKHTPCVWRLNWNGNDIFLIKFSSLTALEVVKMTTSSAVSDENFIKMTIFLFQCIMQGTDKSSELILILTDIQTHLIIRINIKFNKNIFVVMPWQVFQSNITLELIIQHHRHATTPQVLKYIKIYQNYTKKGCSNGSSFDTSF